MAAPETAEQRHSAWLALEAHYAASGKTEMKQLFAEDPKRGERMTLEAAGLLLDYSKNRVTDETLKLLQSIAEAAGLKQSTEAMFTGQKINTTEKRAVLHVALRAPKGESIVVDGEDVVPQVHAVLDKMSGFAEKVRSGAWKGASGKRIKNVVNVWGR